MSELKAYYPHANRDGFYHKSEADKVIAEKDKEILDLIEKVQKERAAKVDYKISANDLRTGLEKAYEEIRMLRRALWLKRADDAKHLVVAYENYDYLDCQEMTIKQESARTWMTCKLRTAEEWVKVWKNVERKCRAKAEVNK